MNDHITRPAFIKLPTQAKDITGQTFGRLTALGPVGRKRRKIVWLCQCSCGNLYSVEGVYLRVGNTRSCGCLAPDINAERMSTHGMHSDPLYQVWQAMIKRCINCNDSRYSSYGGRGIAISGEWRHDFKAFYNHVSQLPNFRKKGYSLDRIDNDGNYEPGNVRWATTGQQNRNNRRTHLVTHNGKTQCLTDWAQEYGLNRRTFTMRLERGWTFERALTEPIRQWPLSDIRAG
jgi:hypothetical protein